MPEAQAESRGTEVPKRSVGCLVVLLWVAFFLCVGIAAGLVGSAPYAGAAFLGVAGLLFAVKGATTFRMPWLMLKTTRTLVGELRPAPVVEVQGEVGLLPGEELRAPGSGAPCAFYRYEFQRYHSGKNSGWRTKHEERRIVPFLLRDETGSVLVMPGQQGPDHVELDQYVPGGHHERHAEWRLDPGDYLHVIGAAEPLRRLRHELDEDTRRDVAIVKPSTPAGFLYFANRLEIDAVVGRVCWTVFYLVLGACLLALGFLAAAMG